MLFARHWAGLSDPRNHHGGAANWPLRAAVYLPPLVMAALSWKLQIDISRAAAVLAGGFALVAGVLIAAFAQIAGWRGRLDSRALSGRIESEAPARRAVDAAAAHSLVGVAASVTATALAVAVEALQKPPLPLVWTLAAVSTWVATLLLLLVHTLFQGYEINADKAVSEADDGLLTSPKEPLNEIRARNE
jgi:hypothetical protein